MVDLSEPADQAFHDISPGGENRETPD